MWGAWLVPRPGVPAVVSPAQPSPVGLPGLQQAQPSPVCHSLPPPAFPYSDAAATI